MKLIGLLLKNSGKNFFLVAIFSLLSGASGYYRSSPSAAQPGNSGTSEINASSS